MYHRVAWGCRVLWLVKVYKVCHNQTTAICAFKSKLAVTFHVRGGNLCINAAAKHGKWKLSHESFRMLCFEMIHVLVLWLLSQVYISDNK